MDEVNAWNEQHRKEIEGRNTNRNKIAELIRQIESSRRREHEVRCVTIQ